MGHLIGGGFINNAKNDKQALSYGLEMAEEFAYYEGDREEGSDTYHGNFRLYNKEFENEDDALEFFDRLGSYCDGVVKVKCPSESSKKRYYEKVRRLENKKHEFQNKLLEEFDKRKSNTIGCKKCGTRYENKQARRNRLFCTSCGNLMISDGAKKRMKSYDDKIREAEIQYKKDISDNGKLRYYAKYEIHV